MLSELQAVAERLAADLGRAVAVDDLDLHLLVHTAHAGPLDEARQRSVLERQVDAELVDYVRSHGVHRATQPWVVVPAWPERGLLRRVCLPCRGSDGRALGLLWLIDDAAELDDAQLQRAADAAAEAGSVLERDAERSGSEALLRDLLLGDDSARTAAAEALRPRLSGATLWRVSASRAPAPGPGWRTRDGDVVLELVPGTAPAAAGAVVRGLGEAVPPARVAESARQARLALRVAEACPRLGAEARWEELGAWQAAVHLDPSFAVPARLSVLLDGEAGRELARSVEAWLDAGGDARRAADELVVHRATLYARLARFTELTGLDLGEGDDRLAAHLGLRAARLDGRLRG